MSFVKDLILETYDERYESYSKASEVIQKTLEHIAESLDVECSVIASRIKSRDSLAKKIDRKGNKYKSIDDLTDIVGTRVVTFFLNDVDKIAAKVISTFEIDWENSIDKRKLYNTDQFGYVSLHYIVRIPKKIYFDEKHPEINEFRTEIQVRTNLQHTWASIYHRTGYKSDVEIPKDLARQFSRLAGLLELADQEFQNMNDSMMEYRRRIASVVKSGNFAEVELNGDSFNAYIQSGGFDRINERIASINSMEIEPASLTHFLIVFKYLGFKTLEDIDNLTKNYSELAYQFAVLQFSGTDIDIITTAAGPFALSVVYMLKNGFGTHDLKSLLDFVYGERNTNISIAAKFIKHGVTLGIVKEEE